MRFIWSQSGDILVFLKGSYPGDSISNTCICKTGHSSRKWE